MFLSQKCQDIFSKNSTTYLFFSKFSNLICKNFQQNQGKTQNTQTSAKTSKTPAKAWQTKKKTAWNIRQSFTRAKAKLVWTLDTVTFVKAVNTSGCINKFLLASIERMACRTNFNMNIFWCWSCFNYVSTNACNLCKIVIRMDSLFHKNLQYIYRFCPAMRKQSFKSSPQNQQIQNNRNLCK